jgi:hypothetical protein
MDFHLYKPSIDALLKYEELRADSGENGADLLSMAKPVLLQFSLFVPLRKAPVAPVPIQLPYPFFDEANGDAICLFVKTDELKAIQDYHHLHPIPGVATIMSLTQLLTDHSTLKHREAILKGHTRFLVDNRIFNHVLNTLGSKFRRNSSKKNIPTPITFETPEELSEQVLRMTHSTTLICTKNAKNLDVIIGSTDQSAHDLYKNARAAINAIFPRILDYATKTEEEEEDSNSESGEEGENSESEQEEYIVNEHWLVLGLYVKTRTSYSFALWKKVLDEEESEEGEENKQEEEVEEEEEEEEEAEEEEEEEVAQKRRRSSRVAKQTPTKRLSLGRRTKKQRR